MLQASPRSQPADRQEQLVSNILLVPPSQCIIHTHRVGGMTAASYKIIITATIMLATGHSSLLGASLGTIKSLRLHVPRWLLG